jgi:hypothetical protein
MAAAERPTPATMDPVLDAHEVEGIWSMRAEALSSVDAAPQHAHITERQLF